MRKLKAVLFTLMAVFLTAVPYQSSAQSDLDHIVIIGEGMKGAQIAIPLGDTIRIRLEGRNSKGKPVPLDRAKIEWGAKKTPSFVGRFKDGYVLVTAVRDALSAPVSERSGSASDAAFARYKNDSWTGECAALGDEPTATLTAKYEGLSATIVLHSVLNLEGKWHLSVTGEEIDLNLRQSGRWVVDGDGRRGEVCGRMLGLEIAHPIQVWFIKTTVDLEPLLLFSDRSHGVGKVKVPDKEKPVRFNVEKTN